MNLEIAAPITLVAVAAAVVVGKFWLGPLRSRRRITAFLTSRSWLPIPPESDQSWGEVMRLAVEGNRGARRTVAHDERFGPITEHYERTETRSGRTLAAFRDPGTMRPRFAGIGVVRVTVDSRSRGFPAPTRKRTTTSQREVWIGEAVSTGIAEPVMVFHGVWERFGDAARTTATGRGVDAAQLGMLPSSSPETPADAVRRVTLACPEAHDALVEVYLGPEAWAMTVPLARAPRRLAPLLALADTIASVLRR